MSRFWFFVLAGLVLALPVYAQTVIFDDGFDPVINGQIWPDGPWWDLQNPNPWGHHLESDTSHVHSPPGAARASVNYRVAYNKLHALGSLYLENVYLRAWIFEDDDITPSPSEWEPNGYITLSNTNAVSLPVPLGDDWYRIGVRGRYATIPRPQWGSHLFVETKTDGAVLLLDWPRRQGWRKYAIELYPATASPGDVNFYVDDTLVYAGRRDVDSFVDRIIAGANVWTYETYWYDDFQFGWISIPTDCATLAEAKGHADGTWVRVSGKVVSGRYTKGPFAGWVTIEEPSRCAGLWVSSSKELDPGDVVTIRGRMATNTAGQRYLDAAEIIVTQASGPPAEPLGMIGRALTHSPDPGGMCVKLWGRVTGRGQEQTGDWRHYLVLETPGLDESLRVYYDNIADGLGSPIPDPNNGDFVLVTGSAGQEMIGAETVRTLWVRQAGDLQIMQ